MQDRLWGMHVVVLDVASWMAVHWRSWTAAGITPPGVQSLGADAGFAQVNYEDCTVAPTRLSFLWKKRRLSDRACSIYFNQRREK